MRLVVDPGTLRRREVEDIDGYAARPSPTATLGSEVTET
jgi:hypothetical protein